MDVALDADAELLLDSVQQFTAEQGLQVAVSTLADVGTFAVCGARLDDGARSVGWGLARAVPSLSPAVAAAEAVEHLVASGYFPQLLGPVVTVDAEQIGATDGELHDDRLLGWIRSAGAGGPLECRPYELVAGMGAPVARLPRFLVEMDYWRGAPVDERVRSYVRYGSTTGWSVAGSAREARMRGTLEVLERDAISRFMLSVYLDRPYPCWYVPLGARNETTRRAAAEVAAWLGGHQVVVLALTPPDSDLTVCVASAADDSQPGGRILGKGASTDPDVACQRAIGELCQIYSVGRHAWMDLDDEGISDRFRRVHPRGVSVMDLHLCPGELDFEVPEWSDRRTRRLSLSDWYAELTAGTDRPFYALDAELVPGRLYCSSAYVPGAERFFLTEHGIEVAPTGHEPLQPGLLDLHPVRRRLVAAAEETV